MWYNRVGEVLSVGETRSTSGPIGTIIEVRETLRNYRGVGDGKSNLLFHETHVPLLTPLNGVTSFCLSTQDIV